MGKRLFGLILAYLRSLRHNLLVLHSFGHREARRDQDLPIRGAGAEALLVEAPVKDLSGDTSPNTLSEVPHKADSRIKKCDALAGSPGINQREDQEDR